MTILGFSFSFTVMGWTVATDNNLSKEREG